MNNTKMKKSLLITFLVFVVLIGYFTSSCSRKKSDVQPQPQSESDVQSKDNDELEKELVRLQEQNNTLRKENNRLTTELQNISHSASENNSTISNPNASPTPVVQMENLYLRIKFWEDGKNYQLYDDSSWYLDPYLSQKGTGSPIIVSPMIYELELENGQTVYHVMSSSGLIYMKEYPDLEEIEEPAEILHSSIDTVANDAYLALLFYKDGSFQKLYEDSEQFWYDDCYLSHQIPNSSEVKISSVHTDCITLKNNVEVYSALAENGTVLWMNESPDLEELE